MSKLEGLNVVIFEARHSQTMCDLVKLAGGNPHAAPAMKEVPIENNPEAFSFAERLFRNEINAVIFLTGVGTRTLVSVLETRYKKEDILVALRKVPVVPRGPKPIRVLKELGVPFAVTVPEPNTWREILETLDQNKKLVPLKGKTVAVQEYGVLNESLLQGLKERGADVLRVPVYRWALPDDTAPLERAIRDVIEGKVDVAMFTTAVQVDHLFIVAGRMNLEKQLKSALEKTVVASVGPDCSENLAAHGISADIEPQSPKMGPLVAETAEKAGEILKSKKRIQK